MYKQICVKCAKEFTPKPYTKIEERFGEPTRELEIIPDMCSECYADSLFDEEFEDEPINDRRVNI